MSTVLPRRPARLQCASVQAHPASTADENTDPAKAVPCTLTFSSSGELSVSLSASVEGNRTQCTRMRRESGIVAHSLRVSALSLPSGRAERFFWSLTKQTGRRSKKADKSTDVFIQDTNAKLVFCCSVQDTSKGNVPVDRPAGRWEPDELLQRACNVPTCQSVDKQPRGFSNNASPELPRMAVAKTESPAVDE